MTSLRIALRAIASAVVCAVVFPALSAAQGDSLPVSPSAVDALRRAGRPLFYNPWFRWVERVTIIDMMPNPQSNETNNDAEPNLAVDPSNTMRIVGSAFTPSPSGATTVAPVYVSTDAGNTWALTEIVPSSNGMTGDISLDFAQRGHTLYTGILRGGGGLRQVMLRSSDPFTNGVMTVLTDHTTDRRDQPYMSATTTSVAGTDRDRVYAGFNFYSQRLGSGGTGRTAAVEFSLDARTAAAPAGFTTLTVEARNTGQQDMPATRFAPHSGGVIYGVFYRWTAGSNLPSALCDVVVVRDDSFATGASPFTALTDPSDGVAGRLVVTGRTVTAFPASLGQNRLVASNLSIAVSPLNAAVVYIAWADSDATSRYTLHVRRSTDSGSTWSADLLTIASATNPALAINSNGVVGFLYQQLTGSAPAQRWQTHLRRLFTGTTWSDLVLANTPNSAFSQFMGDYLDLIAVGRTFFGIFPTINTPDLANFPQGVSFLRNADFVTHQVRNQTNTSNVTASIDPFFFKVEPPTVLDICSLVPLLCRDVTYEPGRIIFPVDTFPVRVVDPIPKNCLVKWTCPGCPKALCPPFYHIFLDDIDPAMWKVQILGNRGELVTQQLSKAGKAIVISFRPHKGNFREKDIGDYYLTFESLGRVPKGTVSFGTRLEASEFPQAEHMRRRGSR